MPRGVVDPPSADVLIVEDDTGMRELLDELLRMRGHRTVAVPDAARALEEFARSDFDLVLTDLQLQGMSGVDLCERLVESRPDVPVIVLTAFGSLETAVAAIRAGAYDFLSKPVETDALQLAVERALQHRALREEVRRLRHELDATHGTEDLLGESRPMEELRHMIARVALSDVSVLLTGESGTGKEVVARAIHRTSARSAKPFVAINCAAVPEQLLEAELFGHVRGAFTDARNARTGLFQQANGGTLFLDELGEMPLGLQPKLLRVLQERTVRPLGSDKEIAVDVRVITATNRDLQAEIEAKRFREDLYYRVNVVHIALPTLRERGNDILLLAQHFLRVAADRMRRPVRSFSAPAAEKLLAYSWPGNVRELQNCIERAVALARFDEISVDDLTDRIRDHQRTYAVVASDNPGEILPMDVVERQYVMRVLAAVGGNKATAAKLLGFDRATLYRKLERWGASG